MNSSLKICIFQNIKYTVHFENLGSISFFKEINTFIYQGCIKLIKSDDKDIYNVTKDFYFK